MAFVDGRLYVAGLSNEEFASKLRSVTYPFSDRRQRHERRDLPRQPRPVRDALAGLHLRAVQGQRRRPHLIAGYLCTPLVKFPVASLKPGAKVVGTTIAELGNRNRPIDMIVYKKDGKEFLLMSNNSRGVMKIPTDGFATADGITEPRRADKAGVGYETIAAMKGIEQLDLLDATHSIVLARTDAGVAQPRRRRPAVDRVDAMLSTVRRARQSLPRSCLSSGGRSRRAPARRSSGPPRIELNTRRRSRRRSTSLGLSRGPSLSTLDARRSRDEWLGDPARQRGRGRRSAADGADARQLRRGRHAAAVHADVPARSRPAVRRRRS